MDRHKIIDLLKSLHISFINYIDDLPGNSFLFSHDQKWTAGQQLRHIHLSVKPLNLVLSLPKFLTRFIFGKANRPGKTYDDLVKKYLHKLKNGGRATSRFIPKSIAFADKQNLIKVLDKNIFKLCSTIENFTETELDTIILPHPLLGKLTLREMLYFTIYHVGHHHEIVKRNVDNMPAIK